MTPLVIGHRGAAAHALENTAASFEAALRLGVDMIEIDIHESLDGEFIVIHDSHVGRLSSRREVVRKTHSRVLRSIELHGQQRLLTLSEACVAIPREVALMIEIKAMRNLEGMANLISNERRSREVLVTSFDFVLLRELQAHSDGLQLGVVSKTEANLFKVKTLALKARAVCLDYHFLTRKSVSRLKEEWGKVYVWTVDRPSEIRMMLECGVDGVISNRPDEVRKVLKNFPAKAAC